MVTELGIQSKSTKTYLSNTPLQFVSWCPSRQCGCSWVGVFFPSAFLPCRGRFPRWTNHKMCCVRLSMPLLSFCVSLFAFFFLILTDTLCARPFSPENSLQRTQKQAIRRASHFVSSKCNARTPEIPLFASIFLQRYSMSVPLHTVFRGTIRWLGLYLSYVSLITHSCLKHKSSLGTAM